MSGYSGNPKGAGSSPRRDKS